MARLRLKNRAKLSVPIGIVIANVSLKFATCRLDFLLLITIQTYLLAGRFCLIWQKNNPVRL